jgi:hypothetical protein
VPSSLIFAGLVATWLAVLVPMAARRRQPTPRPSDAALSGRVLQRPRRRDSEVTAMDAAANAPVPNDRYPSDNYDRDSYDGDSYDGDSYDGDSYDGDSHEPGSYDPAAPGSVHYRSPAPRYRPGRGGYDAEAAEMAAAARYVFRQRLMLGLVLLAVATGLVAGGMGLTGGWFVHAAVDLCLIGYLAYLRRQVRLEQSIRSRRAARLAGGRHPGAAGSAPGSPLLEDPLGGDQGWGEERRARRPRDSEYDAGHAETGHAETGYAETGYADAEYEDEYEEDYDGEAADPELSDDGTAYQDELDDQVPALPRLRPTAPPERPRGTVVLELDDEDPELHELDSQRLRGYRRASGQ